MRKIENLRRALGFVAKLDYEIQDAKMHLVDLDEIESLVEKLENLISDELIKLELEALDNMV